MKDGFVVTQKHGRLHYLEEGTGRPLILLHSNGNSGHEYEEMLKILGPRYRVIAWDQPGQGDSDRITRHHTVEDYADAVIGLMDALDIKQASVLGASIGGLICTDLGARHAGRIDRLFIVEAPARSPEEWAKEWPRLETSWTAPTQTIDQLTPRMRQVTPETLRRWNIDRNKAGAWTMLDAMWALRLYDSHAAIPRVSARTMAIFGEKNAIKAYAPLYERGVKGIKVVIMKDCGHFPMRDDPQGLSRLVDEFISG
jgi:3-oxoadipate enol-lactonase